MIKWAYPAFTDFKENNMKPFIFSALVLLGAGLFAQHNNRSARNLQFNFSNPGARSLAFGGAFVGLADDATAPIANPAGMSLTTSRSFSFELSYSRNDNNVPFAGGNVTQTNLFEFDFNFEEDSFPEDHFGVPYLAGVFVKDDWRFGFFLHEQANVRRQYQTERIHFNLQNTSLNIAYDASEDLLDMTIRQAGASVAKSFGEKASFGASVFYSDLDYKANSAILLQNTFGDIFPVEQKAEGNDQDLGIILGGLFHFNTYISAGVTFKKQPEFNYTASQTSTLVNPDNPDFSIEAPFKIPDSLNMGISVKASDTYTINLDVNRIYYSQITDDLLDFANVEGVTQTMPDVSEIHVGMEWAFPNFVNPLFIRVGYWLDPYHAATNNIEDSQILTGTSQDPRVRDFFFLRTFEEDQHHFSGGFGVTFNNKFQLDFGFDLGDESTEVTAGGIILF